MATATKAAAKKPARKKEPRTFVLKKPRMKGDDVKAWQQTIKTVFKREFNMNCPIKADGIYGPSSRSYSEELCKSMGLSNTAMANGVTPELRSKLRNDTCSAAEKKVRSSKARKDFREKLRRQFKQERKPKVSQPVRKIIQDSWDYRPGHDGIDVICAEDAVLFAMVKSKVIDVRSGGWWGNNPQGDVSKGDGIIQLEVLESVGPFKKGQHIGYGHAEKARVRVGEVVKAGEPIGRAGLANVPHIHLMLNDGSTTRGVGNLNPRACLEYTKKHG